MVILRPPTKEITVKVTKKDLRKLRVLVVGLGEIGQPLLDIVSKRFTAQGLDLPPTTIEPPIDVMHICFPYSSRFVENTAKYIEFFKPSLTLIESTVLPSTTAQIHRLAKTPICHSPVRGNKKDGFEWGYFHYTKFIGPILKTYGTFAAAYYQTLGFKTYLCKSAFETELMKLLNTTYYGLQITWFQEIQRMCKHLGADEENIHHFFRTNEEDSYGRHPRPVFKPNVIEGHCVIPNAQLLNKAYPSPFIKALLESNEKRKTEKD